MFEKREISPKTPGWVSRPSRPQRAIIGRSVQAAIVMVGNILCFFKANTVPCKACRADQCQSAYVLGQRRANGRAGGGGGDADHALTATFRYFVGFHSAASRRASA